MGRFVGNLLRASIFAEKDKTLRVTFPVGERMKRPRAPTVESSSDDLVVLIPSPLEVVGENKSDPVSVDIEVENRPLNPVRLRLG